MTYSPNQRTTIDQEVYKWVVQQKEKDKIVTANTIRQKAFELGQEFDPNFKASLNWYNNWKKRYDYNETPEAEALKHKKRHYTAAFKLHAVRRAAEMESASQAALELDVSRRCLQRWTEELDLITSVAEHSSNAVYRRPGQGRKVFDANLDKQLLEWLKDCWNKGENVTSCTIREKARELSKSPGFKASLGWYIKWQKRHGIDLKIQSCNVPSEDTISPLKLRLLQEGEVYTYTPGLPSAKRRKTTKKKLSYDDEALLENDEEFDRQLLTWLVERWEAGDIVTDRMVKDRATELSSNSEFKATKLWLSAWKRKYNISLENQTYGNEGEEEAEEIVEESEIYDNNEVLLEEQAAGSSKGNLKPDTENPLTPTKEEAATALASLSAEDHEAAGLEIAEALQKLANAFGIVQGADTAKEAMAQLTAAYQAENPDFVIGGGEGQVGVEEVISEEVVTDEPMVVIENGMAEVMQTEIRTSGAGNAADIPPATHANTDLSSSHLSDSFVTEEVVISDPNSASGGVADDSQVQVVVQEQGSGDPATAQVHIVVQEQGVGEIIAAQQTPATAQAEVVSVVTAHAPKEQGPGDFVPPTSSSAQVHVVIQDQGPKDIVITPTVAATVVTIPPPVFMVSSQSSPVPHAAEDQGGEDVIPTPTPAAPHVVDPTPTPTPTMVEEPAAPTPTTTQEVVQDSVDQVQVFVQEQGSGVAPTPVSTVDQDIIAAPTPADAQELLDTIQECMRVSGDVGSVITQGEGEGVVEEKATEGNEEAVEQSTI